MRNKNRKSILIILIAVLVSAIGLGGCGKRDSEKARLNVLCSFLPVWIFTANIVGEVEGVRLEMLLPAGVSPHDFALTTGDMRKIADADIIILNGHDLELFLGNTIERQNPKAVQIVASEKVKPVFFNGENHHEHNEGHHHHGHHHGDINPHTWVSPKQAILMVETIRDGLIKADPEHTDEYRRNAEDFIRQLKDLVKDYETASAEFRKRKIVTGHHAFEYLAEDFNLEIVAVIQEIQEQQPSAGEMRRIIGKIKASGATAVFTEPLVASNVAKSITDETGLPLLTLDPVGTGRQDKNEYIRIMRENLDELRKALM